MKRYRIGNWAQYNQALINRGSVTFWIEDGAFEKWVATEHTGRRGRPQCYSNEAILVLLVVREVYRLPLRALQGFVSSIFLLMGLALPIPCYSQVSRRAQQLSKSLNRVLRREVSDIVFDSTGLKVYGEGEWKVRVHGKGKRRSWKKFHLGTDPNTQEIVLWSLTPKESGDAQVAEELLSETAGELNRVYGDGAYDSCSLRASIYSRGGQSLIPVPKNAAYKGAPHGWERERDEWIALITALGSDEMAHRLCKKFSGYHRRSLGETVFFRIKTMLGANLKARSHEAQLSEVYCKCLVINKMTSLGMPDGWWEVAA